MTDFFDGASAKDVVMLTVAVLGMPFLFMVAITFALKQFVALRAKPDHRAFMTVMPAYVCVTLVFIFGFSGDGLLQIILPLATIPMAWVVYVWWRREFRTSWVEDPSQIADGVVLSNDDWRRGLLALLTMIAIATGKFLLTR